MVVGHWVSLVVSSRGRRRVQTGCRLRLQDENGIDDRSALCYNGDKTWIAQARAASLRNRASNVGAGEYLLASPAEMSPPAGQHYSFGACGKQI